MILYRYQSHWGQNTSHLTLYKQTRRNLTTRHVKENSYFVPKMQTLQIPTKYERKVLYTCMWQVQIVSSAILSWKAFTSEHLIARNLHNTLFQLCISYFTVRYLYFLTPMLLSILRRPTIFGIFRCHDALFM